MTYEKTDSFTGKRTLRIAKPIVADVMYPPDYFLKKAIKGIKKIGDKIGDTKVATKIRNTKAYQNVAKPILKVAVPVAAAVGLGALAAPIVGKGINALKIKKAANLVDGKGIVGTKLGAPVMKTDIVSSVTGAKGTPLVKSGLFSGLKESLVSKAQGIPGTVAKSLIAQGKGILSNEQLAFQDARTSAEMLPKTQELKQAEELYLATPEQTPSQGMPNLQAGGFSISPIAIVGFLLVVVAIGFFDKK